MVLKVKLNVSFAQQTGFQHQVLFLLLQVCCIALHIVCHFLSLFSVIYILSNGRKKPTGGIVGMILLLVVVKALLHLYDHYMTKGEDRARMEKFSLP